MTDLYVLTATFNSEGTIQRCMESVDEIKELSINHIILDGGSFDSTCALIEKQINAQRTLHKQVSKGLYAALNELVKLVPKGKPFLFLHSDDVIIDGKVLKDQLSIVKDQPDLITYSDLLFLDSENNIVRKWIARKYSKWFVYLGWMPPHVTLIMTRQTFEKAGYFDEGFLVSGDYHQFLKINKNKNIKFKYIKGVFVAMSPGGISYKNRFLAFREDIKALKVCGYRFTVAIAMSKRFIKLLQIL